MPAIIKKLSAREILDSRGIPTLECWLELSNGIRTASSIGSGLVGKSDTYTELRDREQSRYFGYGVLKAVDLINGEINSALHGMHVDQQVEIDNLLTKLKNHHQNDQFGTNTLLAVSQVIVKAAAINLQLPTYFYLAKLAANEFSQLRIPTPIFDIIDGGKHGAGNLNFQEFQITPSSVKSYSEALQIGVEVYLTLNQLLKDRKASTSTGLTGGFAPNLYTNPDALEIISQAITTAGRIAGQDVFIGIDVAADQIEHDKQYKLIDRVQPYQADDLAQYYISLVSKYNLLFIEDPFSSTDINSWKKLTKSLERQTLIVGDDLIGTNSEQLKKAVTDRWCHAFNVKLSQVGTVSRAISLCQYAKQQGIKLFVSHRSGETNDTFIADFAVGIGSEYVKFGAPARGERVVKYNRLLQIEAELHQYHST